jgi:hypothetical protein
VPLPEKPEWLSSSNHLARVAEVLVYGRQASSVKRELLQKPSAM